MIPICVSCRNYNLRENPIMWECDLGLSTYMEKYHYPDGIREFERCDGYEDDE